MARPMLAGCGQHKYMPAKHKNRHMLWLKQCDALGLAAAIPRVRGLLIHVCAFLCAADTKPQVAEAQIRLFLTRELWKELPDSRVRKNG